MFKRLISSALLLAILGATSYAVFTGDDGNDKISAPQSPNPLSVEDLANAMGGSLWKLKIKLPSGIKTARAEVQILDKLGKIDRTFSLPATISLGNSEIVIAMFQAQEDATKGLQKRFSMVSNGGMMTSVQNDPFAGLNVNTLVSPKEVSAGVFELARASKGDAGTPEKIMELHIFPAIESGK